MLDYNSSMDWTGHIAAMQAKRHLNSGVNKTSTQIASKCKVNMLALVQPLLFPRPVVCRRYHMTWSPPFRESNSACERQQAWQRSISNRPSYLHCSHMYGSYHVLTTFSFFLSLTSGSCAPGCEPCGTSGAHFFSFFLFFLLSKNWCNEYITLLLVFAYFLHNLCI